jgi:hypothetical protein
MLSSIAEVVRDLLTFIVVMAALLITLVVVISKMPDSHPTTCDVAIYRAARAPTELAAPFIEDTRRLYEDRHARKEAEKPRQHPLSVAWASTRVISLESRASEEIVIVVEECLASLLG